MKLDGKEEFSNSLLPNSHCRNSSSAVLHFCMDKASAFCSIKVKGPLITAFSCIRCKHSTCSYSWGLHADSLSAMETMDRLFIYFWKKKEWIFLKTFTWSLKIWLYITFNMESWLSHMFWASFRIHRFHFLSSIPKETEHKTFIFWIIEWLNM